MLAAIGLYAVLAHTVASRAGEIAIRGAIGAERPAIVRLIVSQGVRLVLIGITGGLLAAAVAANGLTALLYQVNPREPVVFATVLALFLVVGCLASILPAIRAVRVDPVASLRA